MWEFLNTRKKNNLLLNNKASQQHMVMLFKLVINTDIWLSEHFGLRACTSVAWRVKVCFKDSSIFQRHAAFSYSYHPTQGAGQPLQVK